MNFRNFLKTFFLSRTSLVAGSVIFPSDYYGEMFLKKCTFINYNKDYVISVSSSIILFIRIRYEQNYKCCEKTYLICFVKFMFLDRLVDSWEILMTSFSDKINSTLISLIFCLKWQCFLCHWHYVSVAVVKCKYGFRSNLHTFLTLFFNLVSILFNYL